MDLRKILKTVLVFTFPLLLVGLLGWGLGHEKDFFVVRDLEVEMSFRENQEALLVALKPDIQKSFQSLKGQNIWTVSLSRFRSELLNNPWVKEVELSRRFPGAIFSRVHFNQVSLLFADKKNRLFPVLENGTKMPRIKANVTPVAPLLRNNNIFRDPARLQNVLSLYEQVPAIGAFKKGNIALVDHNSVSGLTLHLIKSDVIVHLGDQNIQTKALQVLRVIDYLESQKHKARVIDASFTKKVLVRPRKRS